MANYVDNEYDFVFTWSCAININGVYSLDQCTKDMVVTLVETIYVPPLYVDVVRSKKDLIPTSFEKNWALT